MIFQLLKVSNYDPVPLSFGIRIWSCSRLAPIYERNPQQTISIGLLIDIQIIGYVFQMFIILSIFDSKYLSGFVREPFGCAQDDHLSAVEVLEMLLPWCGNLETALLSFLRASSQDRELSCVLLAKPSTAYWACFRGAKTVTILEVHPCAAQFAHQRAREEQTYNQWLHFVDKCGNCFQELVT